MKLRDHPIFNRLRAKALRDGLDLLHTTLADSPLGERYWICGGALLGWAREGGLLAHDPDVDFHFWREDEELFLQAVELLVQVGFKRVFCWRNIAGEVSEYVLTYQSIKFEFFAAHRHNDNTRWYLYVGNVKQKIAAMELLRESPGCELESFEFLGKRWLKPKDHEAYLRTVYGDWRKPKPHFDVLTESPCVIRRTLLPGKQAWGGKIRK